MTVLLSIKPKYVDQIASGDKKFEFRRSIFRRDVDKVWVYATSPIKKIVGNFRVGNIIEDDPKNIWPRVHKFSGVTEAEFFDYFEGAELGFALVVEDYFHCEAPLDPKDLFANFTPPQSFCYIDELQMENVWPV